MPKRSIAALNLILMKSEKIHIYVQNKFSFFLCAGASKVDGGKHHYIALQENNDLNVANVVMPPVGFFDKVKPVLS